MLVVEDDADTRALYGILLEDAGFRFVAARHGEQALIMAGDLQPDVILADIGLPGPGDGCWMVRFLKTDPSTSRIPVIGVSGTDPADPQGWADFQTVLIKPVLPDHFVDVLRAALARQEET